MLWVQSTTKDYVRAKNKFLSVSKLFCTEVIIPQILKNLQNQSWHKFIWTNTYIYIYTKTFWSIARMELSSRSTTMTPLLGHDCTRNSAFLLNWETQIFAFSNTVDSTDIIWFCFVQYTGVCWQLCSALFLFCLFFLLSLNPSIIAKEETFFISLT